MDFRIQSVKLAVDAHDADFESEEESGDTRFLCWKPGTFAQFDSATLFDLFFPGILV
jgi:hypothetical protein